MPQVPESSPQESAASTRKSTLDQIRARFDADVERFSDLETGQTATMDAALCLELVARAAAACTPHAKDVLDIGCGAGNFTLRLRQHLAFEHVTFVDLSLPMLNRARERAGQAGLEAALVQGDMRTVPLSANSHDIVLAGATLHHLREESDWDAMFARLCGWLRPGGSLWIFDLVSHEIPAVQQLQWSRYREYLSALGGDAYAEKVLAYIDAEDSPRPLGFQLKLLEKHGIQNVEVLHKNASFAAFGGVKALEP